jgi:uncharacterized membrane protein (DUF485 family)
MDARVSLQDPVRVSGRIEPIDWSKAYRNSHFQHLLRFKAKRIRPAVLIYFLTYVTLSCLAGFAPNLMAIKLIGSFSAGYALILLTYATAWAVAFWYVRVADAEFDPLKQFAIKSIEMEGHSR